MTCGLCGAPLLSMPPPLLSSVHRPRFKHAGGVVALTDEFFMWIIYYRITDWISLNYLLQLGFM